MTIQWIPRATRSNWYANSVKLCDPVHKNYAPKCLMHTGLLPGIV